MVLSEILPSVVEFVRHGADDRETGLPSPAGILQSEAARNTLMRADPVEGEVVILSTPYQRALATAAILGEGLGAQVITGSAEFGRLSNAPRGPKDLDQLLVDQLVAAGLRTDMRLGRLVVVTHAPLAAALESIRQQRRVPTFRIDNGSITPYTVGTWVQP